MREVISYNGEEFFELAKCACVSGVGDKTRKRGHRQTDKRLVKWCPNRKKDAPDF